MGPEFLASPTKRRCAHSHCPQPCHCPPCPVGQNLRAISGPFVVDLAWESLRSWLLGTTAVLTQRHEGHSLGLAPSVWWPNALLLAPATSAVTPMAARAREQNRLGTGFLLTNAACGVGCGTGSKERLSKTGPFLLDGFGASVSLSHCCSLHMGKSGLFPLAGFLGAAPGSPTAMEICTFSSWTSSPDQQLSVPGRVCRAAKPATPWLFIYLLEQRETRLWRHFLTCCVALNQSLDHSVLLFS